MKKLLWSLSVVALGLAIFAAERSQSSEDRATDRAEIRAHIDSIFQAYIHKDRTAVRATHAPEWRGFLTNTESIVRGLDQYMEEAEIALSRPSGMTGYEMVDFDVTFYGDVALVPYIAELTVEIGGVEIFPRLRVLDVYSKLDGHWIQIASNTVLHPETQAAYRQYPRPLATAERRRLLEEREVMWRAWFANDREILESAVPEETLAISASSSDWTDRREVLDGAQRFADSGARLTRLEFPQTEIQTFGDVAILYTSYEYEIDDGGESRVFSGRGTEIFVNRDGRWLEVGWHLDAGAVDAS